MRIQLVAAVSLAPLMMASGAAAQTVINTARTTPVITSTVNNGAADNVRIANNGSITLTSGVGVTIDSNNTVAVDAGGRITMENSADGSTGILVNGGTTGGLTVGGQIIVTDDFTPTDTDNDGDLDGPYATGTGRYGVRVTGPGAFVGDVSLTNGSAITVEGNQSYGVAIQSDLDGDLTAFGGINVVGSESYGIRTTGAITGDVIAGGAITVRGEDAVGVSIENTVGGRFILGGGVTSTGFRYITGLPAGVTLDELDADDILAGGPAVSVAGSVAGGVLLTGLRTDNPATNDDDGDGIIDADDPDDNNDGILDVNDRVAMISSFGEAPALQIGSTTQAITIGVVGTGDQAYGLVNRGEINASGGFDGYSANALRIGIDGGQAVVITGGVRNDGIVNSIAYDGNSTSVLLGSGADVGRILNTNAITSTMRGDGAFNSAAIDIQAGAVLSSLENRGSIRALVAGEAGSAYAIRDASGGLGNIVNYGLILATIEPTDDADDTDDANNLPGDETITGRAIAIDVSANTSGVTLIQDGLNDGDDGGDGVADPDTDGDGVDDDQEPAIVGDILFGSGDDTLDVRNGAVNGALSFGAGQDTLSISGGATVRGAISDSDGLLQVNVTDGVLEARNPTPVTISGLNVGAEGDLLVSIDPASSTNGGFIVNGTANFASGSGVGVRFSSLLQDPTRFVIVQATTLNAGTLDQSQVQANSPYMYVVSGGVDGALNQIYIDARQRTGAEFGFITAENAAYAAFYNNLSSDPELLAAFLAQTGRDGFFDMYEQLLPDHSGGQLMSLATGVDAVTRGLAGRGFPAGNGETSAWLQEINFYADKDKGESYGYRADGFGVAGGVERGTGLGAFGVSLALTSSDLEDPESMGEEQLSAQLLELGLYWRAQGVRWNTWARGAVGYASFDSVRQLVATGINRRNESDWNGYTVALAAGASYDYQTGRWSVRPEAIVEYFRLAEDAREEMGGGDGFDLLIGDRTGHILSSTLAVNIGAGFGENRWLRPEIRLGWRQILSHDPGDTLATFRATGSPFTLSGDSLEGGGPIVGLRLNLGNDLGFLAVEADAELLDSYVRYALLLRASFRF